MPALGDLGVDGWRVGRVFIQVEQELLGGLGDGAACRNALIALRWGQSHIATYFGGCGGDGGEDGALRLEFRPARLPARGASGWERRAVPTNWNDHRRMWGQSRVLTHFGVWVGGGGRADALRLRSGR